MLERFFFFQAEDGIRDGHVTGVQTCALPIYVTKVSFCNHRNSQTLSFRQFASRGFTYKDVVCILADRRCGFTAVRFYQSFGFISRSEEHTSELQSRGHIVCRLLLEKKKTVKREPLGAAHAAR